MGHPEVKNYSDIQMEVLFTMEVATNHPPHIYVLIVDSTFIAFFYETYCKVYILHFDILGNILAMGSTLSSGSIFEKVKTSEPYVVKWPLKKASMR